MNQEESALSLLGQGVREESRASMNECGQDLVWGILGWLVGSLLGEGWACHFSGQHYGFHDP